MEVTSIILFALLIIIISTWFFLRNNGKRTLPGPMGLPIVGYLPFMTKTPYLKLTELAKTYGPVYNIRLGGRNVVVICDYKLMKEAFNNDAFMGRPPDLPIEPSKDALRTKALIGMPWKEQRRFSLHTLRDLGFGKTQTEEHVKEEIIELIERMKEHVQEPVKMSNLLAPSMSNNIASFLFGKRMKYDDPKRQELDRLFSEIGKLLGAVSWQAFFPWLAAFMKYFNIGNSGRMKEAFKAVKEFCRNELEEHEATLDPNNIRDFVDGYLLEIQKRSEDPNSSFKREVLVDLSGGFFGAGSETVRISVDWMLLICAEFPEIQGKIVQEIGEVLGSDRFPSWQDRLRMPFTEAAIWEMMRWRSIISLNIMRYTLKDTELNGYFIPKNTNVLAVIWAIQHDQNLWGKDADDFKPERFFSKDGKKKVEKPEYFIPFSTGKRSCPGEALAQIEVFLYVVALIQKFEFSMPRGKKADFQGVLGIGLQPKRQDMCLKLRQW